MPEQYESTDITVELQDDHLKRITQAQPINAIAELIWNGLDADATHVRVSVERSELRIETIRIEDDGEGIPLADAKSHFKKLGDSWKANAIKSPQGRVIHGKEGQGRFKAFSLGQDVKWIIRYKRDGKIYEYSIHSNANSIRRFSFTNEIESSRNWTGVTVEISDITKNIKVLDDGNENDRLAPIFAVYLTGYSNVKLITPTGLIDIASLIKATTSYPLYDVERNHVIHKVEITICEWNKIDDCGLWLCTSQGFPIQKYSKQIRGLSEFPYTAYLCSTLFEELKKDGTIEFDEMDSYLAETITEAIKTLKDHYKKINDAKRKLLVGKWKAEAVYPFQGEAESELEEAERQIFDIVAIGVSENLNKFEDSDKNVKSLQLKLLKHAISKGPTELNFVLNEVLDLPQEKLDELSDLLKETTLSALISMGKTVSHRLKFLTALEEIIFDEELTEVVKERSQLHKILEDNVWVFGENYSLSVSDKSLTSVLRSVSSEINPEMIIDEPVTRIDGRKGIVDLMLSRAYPGVDETQRHFLVVELKAPKVIVTRKERDQIHDYAMAVVNDLRFQGRNCSWEFILVAKGADQNIQQEIKGAKLGNGAFQQWDEHHATIRFKTWGQIINENKSRMSILSNMLKYANDRDEALQHLKTKYEKFTENIHLTPESDLLLPQLEYVEPST